jgi:hypothetical protein
MFVWWQEKRPIEEIEGGRAAVGGWPLLDFVPFVLVGLLDIIFMAIH